MEAYDNELLLEEEIETPKPKRRRNSPLKYILIGISIVAAIYLAIDRPWEEPPVKISIPQDWIDEFNRFDYPSNRSYSYFSTYIHNFTQVPLIDYNINELDSIHINSRIRGDYINFESNILNEYHNNGALISIINKHGGFPPNFRDHYDKQLKDMINQGIQSYSRLENKRHDFSASNDTMRIQFNSDAHFMIDLDVLLNVFYPLGTGSSAYNKRAFVKKGVTAKQVVLSRNSSSTSKDFNFDKLLFNKTRTNPLKDVSDGITDIGVFLKFNGGRDISKVKQVELPLGTVFYLWSPNVSTQELLSIYNLYVKGALKDFTSSKSNSLLKVNTRWVPDDWQGYLPGHQEQLSKVQTEKDAIGNEPSKPQTYLVYYDSVEPKEFALQLERSSRGNVVFKAQRAIPPEDLIKLVKDDDSAKVLYIYGIDQHSEFSVPIQLISKSFWYKNDNFPKLPNYLRNRVESIIRSFQAKTVLVGQVDTAEYAQFAELERKLTIGEKDSKAGLYPLFTVPYYMAYRTDRFQALEFNSTRGFGKILKK